MALGALPGRSQMGGVSKWAETIPALVTGRAWRLHGASEEHVRRFMRPAGFPDGMQRAACTVDRSCLGLATPAVGFFSPLVLAGSLRRPCRRRAAVRPRKTSARQGNGGAFAAMTCVELRRLCKARSLKTSGRKVELVQRLQEERKSSEGSSVHKTTAKEQLVEILEQPNVDEEKLEEIFNVQVPEVGDLVTGTVVALVGWGAFVELDESGFTGLLHISEVSHTFVDNIEDYIHPGQKVEVMVIKPRGNDQRMCLSLKQAKSPTRLRPPPQGGALPGDTQHAGVFNVHELTERMEEMEEALSHMQVRAGALEALLSQLGHGAEIHSAQMAAQESLKKEND